MAKTDKIEYGKRVLTVQSWIIDNVPSALIIQQILHKEWCKSDRQAYRILQAARLQWVKYEDDDIVQKIKLQIQNLKNRIRGMNNEYKGTPIGMNAILAYEKEIAKLEGMHITVMRLSLLPPPSVAPPLPEEEPKDTTPGDLNPFFSSPDVDYTKLDDNILKAIVAARKQTTV